MATLHLSKLSRYLRINYIIHSTINSFPFYNENFDYIFYTLHSYYYNNLFDPINYIAYSRIHECVSLYNKYPFYNKYPNHLIYYYCFLHYHIFFCYNNNNRIPIDNGYSISSSSPPSGRFPPNHTVSKRGNKNSTYS
uniref:Uncharacterized protein n=1 Tax=Pristionchus pacificus TaxID=54126 RepID=A0A2A6BW47_PRIPA|eukprot:PDM70013.1 hypothetical protein PRIPAC_49225 [Pristionchus pacificus]